MGILPASVMVLFSHVGFICAPSYFIEIREKRSGVVAIWSLFFMLLKVKSSAEFGGSSYS